MSFVSSILPSLQAQNSAMSQSLFDMASGDRFYVSCNRTLKRAKDFSRKVAEARSAINSVLDRFHTEGDPSRAATEDDLDEAVDRILAVERSLAHDWDVQRRQMAIIASMIRDAGSTRKALFNRVQNAINNVYHEALTTLRDGRIRLMVLRAEDDELDGREISTPGQLDAYFSDSVHG